jgi:hypothetical protein
MPRFAPCLIPPSPAPGATLEEAVIKARKMRQPESNLPLRSDACVYEMRKAPAASITATVPIKSASLARGCMAATSQGAPGRP